MPNPGSSPRMRGKLGIRTRREGLGRLIPAHAGKTRSFHVSEPSPPAHPRACGENLKCGWAAVATLGSSPRMRGKPRVPLGSGLIRGLIPAHAGKTRRTLEVTRTARAHPRACGENRARPRSCRSRMGSSPRMRGKPGAAGRVSAKVGLIPAHAGKTYRCVSSDAARQAHPRACGENV